MDLGFFGIFAGFWVEVNEVVYVAMACSGVYRAFMNSLKPMQQLGNTSQMTSHSLVVGFSSRTNSI